jgi:hypothetical protein
VYTYPDSAVTATFKLNGVTLDIGGDAIGYIIHQAFPGNLSVNYEATDFITSYVDPWTPYAEYTNRVAILAGSEVNQFMTVATLGEQFLHHDFTADDYSIGYFDRETYDSATNTYSVKANAVLSVTSLTIGEAGAAVPEPATWALMIGGFGLAGSALRRRRVLAR